MAYNPIPFNVDTMSLIQIKECIRILGMAFDGMERNVPHDNIMFHLNEGRKYLLKIKNENDD